MIGCCVCAQFLDVARRQLGERALVTLRSLLTLRILALRHLVQDVVGTFARLREVNRGGISDGVPARTATKRIDDLVRTLPGRLDLQHETSPHRVPVQTAFGVAERREGST